MLLLLVTCIETPSPSPTDPTWLNSQSVEIPKRIFEPLFKYSIFCQITRLSSWMRKIRTLILLNSFLGIINIRLRTTKKTKLTVVFRLRCRVFRCFTFGFCWRPFVVLFFARILGSTQTISVVTNRRPVNKK